MVKLRMNTADVAAEVKCLRKLIGMRCANVYVLSAKIYVFKLMKSSGVTESGESEKVLLLLESGVRLHTTQFSRDKSMTPSGFTLKLRKHIRTKRLEDVRQLGIDRVVDFQFGLGEGAHHIILELYAQGNILLTDAEHKVLTLLRTHRDDETGLTMMPHHRYPIELCRLWEKTSFEKLKLGLLRHETFESIISNKEIGKIDTGCHEQRARKETAQGKENHGNVIPRKKTDGGGKGEKGNLKNILGESLGYGPALSEHVLLEAGLHPNMKAENDEGKCVLSITEEEMKALFAAIVRLEDWMQDVVSGERIPEGYIIMEKKIFQRRQISAKDQEQSKVYCDFSPFLLNQFDSRDFLRLETFDAALDDFFSKIEGQRAEQQRKVQEDSVLQKLDKIRKDQENRVESLKKEVEYSVRMAELIEYNLDDVDAAILAVRTALASGKDWKDLARMVKEEKKAGNPVAGLIHSLQLEKNQVTLLLSNNLDEMDDEEKTQPVDKVEVDLALSAHANARRWYEMKKRQASKQDKTFSAHEKAFKAAERKAQQQLAQAKTVASISHIRKVHWFEKFNWFISSENYLVISGRDAQQNELVVKRHLRKGDLYVHADLHGASSTIIKNHDPEHLIPPLTLNQAGCFTVCRSQAWDSKIVTSAWWVHAHQVSKTAPTGEYLTAGSFVIRGRKNFLPPHPLVMGFGILFRVDESCIAAHWNERKLRVEEEEDDMKSEEVDKAAFVEVSKDTQETVPAMATLRKNLDSVQISDSFDMGSEQGFGGLDSSIENSEEDDILEAMDTAKCNNQSDGHASGVVGELGINEIEPQHSTAFDDLLDKALELSSQSKLGKSGKYDTEAYPDNLVKHRQEFASKTEIMSGNAIQRERPYLSKAERKKLKKGSTYMCAAVEQATVHDVQQQLKTGKGKDKEMPIQRDEHIKESSATGKLARGQRGKLKKKKEKYAEQDEEERELRLALLGSAGKMQSDTDGGAAISKVSESLAKPENSMIDALKVCYKCKKTGHVARDCPAAIFKLNNPQEGSVELDDVAVASKVAEMEKLAVIAEENILELRDEEREKLTELDSLTGCPLPNDILLYAVPVCGPYSALQGYKYRVKLVPGTSKKGKAARTATNVFIHMQDAKSREKELIKAVTEPELVASMISNAKVTAPGLTHLQQRQKKGKKASLSSD